jgi:hypothetical protein
MMLVRRAMCMCYRCYWSFPAGDRASVRVHGTADA